MLTRLKDIKSRKLERAQQALQRALIKVRVKVDEVTKAKQVLSDYIEWRLIEEDQMFEKAYHECLNATGLDKLRHDIGLLRIKDASLSRKILDAEHQVDLAIEEKENCQKDVLHCEKVLEKYTTLLSEELVKQKKNMEREEEQTLDEFTINRFGGAAL